MENKMISNTPFAKFQAHVDLHLPETLPSILSSYDPENFAAAMAQAGVELTGIFAKCHYGNAYYNTQIGNRHPGMSIDYLGDTINSCNKKDIVVMAYMSISRDDYAGRTHPEWRAVREDGTAIIDHELWHAVCLNTAYADYCIDMADELLSKYNIAGVWLDGVKVPPACMCASCRSKYKEIYGKELKSGETQDLNDLRDFQTKSEAQFIQKLTDSLAQHQKEVWLGPVRPQQLKYLKQVPGVKFFVENEVWPRPGDHRDTFSPMLLGLQNRRIKLPYQAMTTISHGGWGEYSLKPVSQLRYETALSACQGASVCLGINLNSDGTWYQEVGDAYSETFSWLKDYIQFCGDDKTPQPLAIHYNSAGGAFSVAQTAHIPFDIETEYNIEKEGPEAHPSWVISNMPRLPESWSNARDYLESGGRLLITGRPPEINGKNAFSLWGLTPENSELIYHDDEFFYAAFPEGEEFSCSQPYLVHGGFYEVKMPDAVASGEIIFPLDSADGKGKIAQVSAPPGKGSGFPAIYRQRIGKGSLTYVPFNLFNNYWSYSHSHYYDIGKQLLLEMTQDLVPFHIDDSYPVTCYGAWRNGHYFLHIINEPVRRPLKRSGPPPSADRFINISNLEVYFKSGNEVSVIEHPSGKKITAQRVDEETVKFIISLEQYSIIEIH
jgi:Hypothetical glycosyl hydrolase 6